MVSNENDQKTYNDNQLRDQEFNKWYYYTNEHGLKARGILHEHDGSFDLQCVVNSAAGIGRQGDEKVLPTGSVAGMSHVDRAHAFGNIIGAETERGVLYAPSIFNREIQTSFFEGPIKYGSQEIEKAGYQTILNAHITGDSQARLTSISYEASFVPIGADPWDRKARVGSLDLGSFNIQWSSNDGADAKITRVKGEKDGLSKLEKLMPDSYNIGESYFKLTHDAKTPDASKKNVEKNDKRDDVKKTKTSKEQKENSKKKQNVSDKGDVPQKKPFSEETSNKTKKNEDKGNKKPQELQDKVPNEKSVLGKHADKADKLTNEVEQKAKASNEKKSVLGKHADKADERLKKQPINSTDLANIMGRAKAENQSPSTNVGRNVDTTQNRSTNQAKSQTTNSSAGRTQGQNASSEGRSQGQNASSEGRSQGQNASSEGRSQGSNANSSNGHSQGHSAGSSAGRTQGQNASSEGRTQGQNASSEGRSQGQNASSEGRSQGQNASSEGRSQGSNANSSNGHSQGHSAGSSAGHSQGHSSSSEGHSPGR